MLIECAVDLLRRNREVADPNAYCVGDGVGDCRCHVPLGKVLLVDEVSTYGGTLGIAVWKLVDHLPDAEITVSTATQMIIKSVVLDETGLRST